MKIIRKLVLVFLIAAFSAVNFSGYPGLLAQADTASEIKDKLDSYEKKLKDAQAALEAEQSKLYKNQTQISATQSLIKKLQDDIARQEAELNSLNERAELNKVMLAEYMRQLYYADRENVSSMRLSLFKGDLNDMVMNFDGMIGIKAKIMDALQVIKDAKTEVAQAKDDLAEQKQDRQEVLQSQRALQNKIAGEVEEKQITVAEIQQKISKLRSTLSSFLGKSYSIEDVVEAVKLASKKTGVRKEFLFAVLDKETDLGRFTGGCTYKNSKMGSTNEKVFKGICEDLGYNYKTVKVSCPLSYGIGGAMGVAQFMPTTWAGTDGKGGYAPKIAALTGNSPADPWSLEDGIMGMALYLKNRGGDKKSGEKTAAAAYYCGSNLSRAVCQNYANTVISWSKGYDEYF